jgi:tRNA 5-methylaminomethyl-2-thiouridine biosynthesis bifunctional protein
LESKQITEQLSARWRNLERFFVLDTCSNAEHFLSTWAAWRDDPARPLQLHYLAVADHVSSFASASQAGLVSAEFPLLANELRSVLPPWVPGLHRVLLDGEQVVLTLIFGDVGQYLPQLNAQVDVFLIDKKLDAHMVKTVTKLAAYDAQLLGENMATDVQPLLEQAGFVFGAESDLSSSNTFHTASFAPRWQRPQPLAQRERKAIVIGAGLAGSAICERLAARGWQLALIERHAQPAQQASGNRAGIFMPLLSKDDNVTARLTRAAYFFARQVWQRIGGIGSAFPGEACGVLQLARDTAHALTQQQTLARWQYPSEFVQWLETDDAAKLLGQTVPNGGLFFSQAGWADPGAVCRALLAACTDKLQMYFSHSALRLEYANGQWRVHDENEVFIAQAQVVILANAADALNFAQTGQLPLSSVRGQVTDIAADALPTLPVVVCRDGYITRSSQGMYSIGASYDLDGDVAQRRSSDVDNIAKLHQMLPDISLDLDRVMHQARVAFRCVSPDRLPLVGALPDATAAFRGDRLRDVPRLSGLYGLLGYASRGLVWSSLAAELLASQLEGEPLPLESDLVDALDPARFLLRAHRKSSALDKR